jgi:hypothetical protein
MAHEYKAEAKASHEKKLKSYGAEKAEGKAKNWAGFDALNTDEQRGLKPIDKEPELSKGTTDRIMRKAGGRVAGADSLKRLDKAPRKGSGVRKGEIPTAMKAMEAKPEKTKHMPDVARRAMGGKMEHDDEVEDRKLVKKMVKGDALTGKCGGGRMKKADGGASGKLPSPEEAMKSEERLKGIKEEVQGDDGNRQLPPPKEAAESAARVGEKRGGRAKRAEGGGLFGDKDGDEAPKASKGKKNGTTVNIMIGGQQPSAQPEINPMALAALAGAGGPPAGPLPAMPPGPPPAAMGAPPPGPVGGPPQMPPGGMPMPRKDGGSVVAKPGTDGYIKTKYGNNGLGRLEKQKLYGTTGPKGQSV